MEGYDANDTMKENTPIGIGVPAVDFPDNNTILIVVNEANIMGDYANTICSKKQMGENGVLGAQD